jgi:hypothetical protein
MKTYTDLVGTTSVIWNKLFVYSNKCAMNNKIGYVREKNIMISPFNNRDLYRNTDTYIIGYNPNAQSQIMDCDWLLAADSF